MPMLFQHMKEELKDAEKAGWREEARLVSRNTIMASAAAFVPFGVLIAIAAMMIWRWVEGVPSLLLHTAYLYPLTGIAGIAFALFLHGKNLFTAAMLSALLPFLWIPTFFGTALYWIFVE